MRTEVGSEPAQKLNSRLVWLQSELAALQSAYAQLLEQNAALYAQSQRQAAWTALISHELRKPLTTISGGLELILTCEPDLPQTVRDTLAIVRAQSLRLGHLVAMILDEAALSSGQPQLHLEPVSLPSVVGALLLEQPPSRPVEWGIPPGLPPIWADPDALSHVLSQLLDHAFKYDQGPVTIQASIRNDQVIVTVAGRGQDLTETEQERLFDSNRLGSGPSLIMARMLIEAMGGRLGMESPPQDGVGFILSLPLAETVLEPDISSA